MKMRHVSLFFCALFISVQSGILEAFYTHFHFSAVRDFTTFFWFGQLLEMFVLSLLFSIIFNFTIDPLLSNPTLLAENPETGTFAAEITFRSYVRAIFKFHDMVKPTRLDLSEELSADNRSVISESNNMDFSVMPGGASFFKAGGTSHRRHDGDLI